MLSKMFTNSDTNKNIIEITATLIRNICRKSLYGEEAKLILQGKINIHNSLGCECYKKDIRDECIAYMWVQGKIDSKNIVADYYYSNRKNNNR